MTDMAITRPSAIAQIDGEALVKIRADFAGRAARFDEFAEFPHENFEQLKAIGALSLVVPAEYGGGGAGLVDAARLIGHVAEGDASTALVLAMNSLMHASLRDRNPPIYPHIAKAAVAGNGILNALRAEPELGSINRGGTVGTIAALQVDGSWVISGRKAYATGSPVVNWWLVFARTDEAVPRIGTWLVPAHAPGVTYIPTWNHMGMRATASHEVELQDVHVPADHVLSLMNPKEANPNPAVLNSWNGILLAALYGGIARAARAWIQLFLFDRVPGSLGAPLATVPRLQAVIGEIDTLLLVNKSLIDQVAGDIDRNGADASPRPNQVKHVVTENAIRVVDLALSISGNHGLDRANPLERHHRDVLCGRVHAPQGDSILVAAGKASLGL